jgi:Skp family chaperone for outer membrane proteins
MDAGGRLLIAAACTLVAVSAFAQVPNQTQFAMAGVRLGWFSPQRAFSESLEGKAAIARLTALQNEKTRAIEEKNNELRVQEQALQNEPLLNEEARKQKSTALEKFRIDVQRLIQDAQADLMGAQHDVESAFLFKVTIRVQSRRRTDRLGRSVDGHHR